jgi:hypothetical protein
LLFFPAAGGLPNAPFDIRTLHCGEAVDKDAMSEKWIAQVSVCLIVSLLDTNQNCILNFAFCIIIFSCGCDKGHTNQLPLLGMNIVKHTRQLATIAYQRNG